MPGREKTRRKPKGRAKLVATRNGLWIRPGSFSGFVALMLTGTSDPDKPSWQTTPSGQRSYCGLPNMSRALACLCNEHVGRNPGRRCAVAARRAQSAAGLAQFPSRARNVCRGGAPAAFAVLMSFTTAPDWKKTAWTFCVTGTVREANRSCERLMYKRASRIDWKWLLDASRFILWPSKS